MSVTYLYPGINRKTPPIKMEDVPLGAEDTLLHIRSHEPPYMLINQDGSWPHVVACVLAYVMQRQDMFDICLQSWIRELMKDPKRWEMFKPVLRERANVLPEHRTQDAQKHLQSDERGKR
jgi:hypothetical protein